MAVDTEELLTPDVVAQARAMWQSEFWQRVARYCRARRDTLVSAVDPPADTRALWIREGAVAELNRILRGDSFLVEVIRDAQARHAAQAAAPEEEPPPPWMRLAGIPAGTDVAN